MKPVRVCVQCSSLHIMSSNKSSASAQQAVSSSFSCGATASASDTSLTNSTSGSSKMKPKKFCTRGQEFLDLLKSLGYVPPKHQQADHFEYLFQDEKSAGFVKKLVSTLSPENCLTPQEITRYLSRMTSHQNVNCIRFYSIYILKYLNIVLSILL